MDILRRRIISAAGAATLLGMLPRRLEAAEASSAEEPYADAEEANAWMRKLDGFGAANGALLLGRFADRMYFTTGPIGWEPNQGQKGPAPVEVPVGFVTDLASIPRIFWSILPSDGNYAYSAIIHDYLYWEQTVSRVDADQVLRLSMADFHVNRRTISAIYTAVRKLGGQRAWDENARRKAHGERRIIKKFPDDPTVRWETWKMQPGVYR